MSPVSTPAPPATATAALVAAADAAVAALPLGRPARAGRPVSPAAAVLPEGPAAVGADFRGSRRGAVAVVVGRELAAALAGGGDLGAALQPAVEVLAQATGPAVVEPAARREPVDALAAVAGSGDAAVVPVLDEATGEVLALLALGAAADAGGAPAQPPAGGGLTGLHLLHDVEMAVTVELGRTRMTVRDLLSIAPGTVVELDRAAGSPADLLVNGRLIARGEVVVVDEEYGIRIVEIVSGEGTVT